MSFESIARMIIPKAEWLLETMQKMTKLQKNRQPDAGVKPKQTPYQQVVIKKFGHIDKKHYFCILKKRRDGRAVDCGGLENR